MKGPRGTATPLVPLLALPLLASVGVGLVAGCGGDGARGAPGESADDRSPRQLVIAYDRSTSITASELCGYQRLTDQVVDYLDHGDRIAAIEILQLSLDETPRRWTQRVPDRELGGRMAHRDDENRARFLKDVRDYLAAYTDPEGRDDYMGTDILSTLYDIAEEIRAYPDHGTTVVLFSDMMQATQEINMEGLLRMPPPDWISRRADEGRLPALDGACIVVAGARTDTDEGQRVKAFWQEYFEATGATLLDRNYAYRPVRIPEEPC